MSTKAQTMAGDGAKETVRLNEHYATPSWVTGGLIRRERLYGHIWEPACGEGYITKVLYQNPYLSLYSSDKYETVPVRKPEITKAQMKELCHLVKTKAITQEEFLVRGFNMVPILAEAESGIDFLNDSIILSRLSLYLRDYPTIIMTNPPFSLFLDFVLQAKKYAKNKIIFFGKLNFLSCQNRSDMWEDTLFPLKKVIVLVDRVKFPGYDDTSPLEMAFYVWDRDYEGKPTIEIMRK